MRTKKVFIFFVVILAFCFLIFSFVEYFGRSKYASLEVNTDTDSSILINGNNFGTKTYTGIFPEGKTVVEIGSYKTRVDLVSGIKTVVNSFFDSQNNLFYGENLSFVKSTQNDVGLVVISQPNADLYVDGIYKGVTPLRVDNISVGVHKLSLGAETYLTRTFDINLTAGYKLTVDVWLDLLPSKKESPKTDVYVHILSTPNGFLRVRNEPNVNSTEVGQVSTGGSYLFLSQDAKSGWYHIQYTATASGWVSNLYSATSSALLKN